MTAVPGAGGAGSIVDALIAERAPGLSRHRASALLLRRWLYPMLKYPAACHFAAAIAPMPGPAVLDFAAAELALDLRIQGLDHVPRDGRAILVANHPTGIADGIAVYAALRDLRPDLVFLANADALRVAPGLDTLVVPVDWSPARRSHGGSRETLQGTAAALRAGRLVVMFPSGRLAHLTWRGLRERPWLPTVVNLARKYRAPVVPLHIGARNSPLFYGLSQLSTQLRDITLFNELLNKQGRPFALTFGRARDAEELAGDAAEVTAQLRLLVEDGLRPRRTARLKPWLRRLIPQPA